MATHPNHDRELYWRRNLTYVGCLLFVWFVVSFGCGIVFVEALNRIRVGGFQLGFWFAQQGAMYVFVVLIFVYVFLMNRLDRQHGVSEDAPTHNAVSVASKRSTHDDDDGSSS